MKRKLVILEEDLVKFAIERCNADEALGKHMVRAAPSVRTGKSMVDYVVLTRRLRDALEKARDET